eukprot:6052045-Prymnesium_polylepis.1
MDPRAQSAVERCGRAPETAPTRSDPLRPAPTRSEPHCGSVNHAPRPRNRRRAHDRLRTAPPATIRA